MLHKFIAGTITGMVFLGLSLALLTNLSASQPAPDKFRNSEITGVISVKGSEPKIYLSITTEKRIVYRLEGRDLGKIQNEYQGKILKLKGKIRQKAKGPGFPALFEIQEILSVEHK